MLDLLNTEMQKAQIAQAAGQPWRATRSATTKSQDTLGVTPAKPHRRKVHYSTTKCRRLSNAILKT